MKTAMLVLVVGVSSTLSRADLIGVATSQDFVWSFYRISTEDASSELITQVQHVLSIESLTFGPDGMYYMITVCAVYRIDPFTGETEYLHRTTDFPSVGGQCMRDDGLLLSMINRYGSAYFQGWDIYEDEYAQSVGTEPAAMNERKPGTARRISAWFSRISGNSDPAGAPASRRKSFCTESSA
jgi:hypothetical protein